MLQICNLRTQSFSDLRSKNFRKFASTLFFWQSCAFFIEICGLIMKICGFRICGLPHLWSLRIYDSGWAQEFEDLRFADLKVVGNEKNGGREGVKCYDMVPDRGDWCLFTIWTLRKTHRSVLIIFIESAALFMADKDWDTTQLNIDILMYGSYVWLTQGFWCVSGEQLPAVNTWVKLMEINCKYVQWLQHAEH